MVVINRSNLAGYCDPGRSVSQSNLTADKNGTVAVYQIFAEVDQIGFTFKYQPITDLPEVRKSGPIYQGMLGKNVDKNPQSTAIRDTVVNGE